MRNVVPLLLKEGTGKMVVAIIDMLYSEHRACLRGVWLIMLLQSIASLFRIVLYTVLLFVERSLSFSGFVP